MTSVSSRIASVSVAALAAGVLIGRALARRSTVRKEARRKRTLLTARVRPDRVALYKRHHSGVWPEVEGGLAKYGVETLSIWADPEDQCRLYLYLEEIEDGASLGGDSAYRANPIVRKWEETMETEFHAGWTACNEWYSLKSCGTRNVIVSTNSLPPCYNIMDGDGK
eukprot:TRINITY_DN48092_c0_g1_i1.p1 TRINITY_DN48092_c0_g1~~TRINITY_DN48092_c0_g1_i1.p1  ORF type:complete len:167 (+),score=5.52 TRINITY_DN48092_c0_g1_i1:81-581(+)